MSMMSCIMGLPSAQNFSALVSRSVCWPISQDSRVPPHLNPGWGNLTEMPPPERNFSAAWALNGSYVISPDPLLGDSFGPGTVRLISRTVPGTGCLPPAICSHSTGVLPGGRILPSHLRAVRVRGLAPRYSGAGAPSLRHTRHVLRPPPGVSRPVPYPAVRPSSPTDHRLTPVVRRGFEPLCAVPAHLPAILFATVVKGNRTPHPRQGDDRNRTGLRSPIGLPRLSSAELHPGLRAAAKSHRP